MGITAQELRIGNLFQEQKTKEIIEVIELSQEKIVFSGSFSREWQAEPIPLTEEWLLKFGFAKNKNTFILNKYSSVTHEKTGFESGFWYSNDESNAHCYRLKKIEFVHQLQNLYYALMGECLQIKEK